MMEHRLIEKMINIASKEVDIIKEDRIIDPAFIATEVDFFRTYADRTHHGKEEDILFQALERKNMSRDDQRTKQELVDEHVRARKEVKELLEANDRYAAGDPGGLDLIMAQLSKLIELYPGHIQKEDKLFFPNAENYFAPDELEQMLKEFWEFDKRMIHEKYNQVYESLVKKYD